MLASLIDFILHIDQHLIELTQTYGLWIYAILFLIVFCETGLVVTPFLPGDSLLFAAGAVAALGGMNVHMAAALLLAAAVIGDAANFAIGKYFGEKLFAKPDSRVFKREYLDKTHAFYEKYGGKTIILARFVPIVRTFAPFVAGVAAMSRRRFTLFNVAGAFVWVIGLCLAGYWFGNLPWVQAHLSKIIWAMIILPGLAALLGGWRARRRPSAA